MNKLAIVMLSLRGKAKMAEIQDGTISDLSEERLGNWLHRAHWDGR